MFSVMFTAPPESLRSPRRTRALLAELGIETITELMQLSPLRLESAGTSESCAEAAERLGGVVQIKAEVKRTRFFRRGGKQSVFTAFLEDSSGAIEAHWFNQSWLRESVLEGAKVTVAGRVGLTKKGKPTLVVPRIGNEEKPLPAPDGWESDFAGLSPLAFGVPHSPVTVIARYRYPSVTLSPVSAL